MTWTSWLYASNSVIPEEQALKEVDRIVEVSRPRNAELNVTGALLFTGQRFVQLLEGPTAGVSALQASIFRDGRHKDIITIDNRDVATRMFSNWSLAYAGPSALVVSSVEEAVQSSEREPRQGVDSLYKLLTLFAPLD